MERQTPCAQEDGRQRAGRESGAVQRRPAIYSRKSKFTGKGESIENQIGLCRRYIRERMGEREEEQALVYEDEGFSGGSLNRPMFRQMMRDARAGKLSSVIVYRLDRISRNIGDFAVLIEELNSLNVSFLSIKEQFDTSSPMGRAMMYIASVFSQLERETIAERIRDNMQELAKTGRWLGGTTPTGYRSRCIPGTSGDGRERRLYCLEEIPEEAELVRRIFQIFLETGSLTETERRLIADGIVTKNGRRFSRFAIRGILQNPVYAGADRAVYAYLKEREAGVYSPERDFDGTHGLIAYNRTLQKKGSVQKSRGEEDWIVAVGRHAGLVEGPSWVEVQRQLERNRSKSYHRPKSEDNEALLSGLLFCAGCGCRMRPKLTARRDGEGRRRFFYLCTGKEKGGPSLCGMKNAEGRALDECAVTVAGRLPWDRASFLRRLAGWRGSWGTGRAGRSLLPARRRLSQVKQEKRGLLSALSIAAERGEKEASGCLLAQLEALCGEELRLEEELERQDRPEECALLTEGEREEACRLLLSFRTLASRMGAEEKRRMMCSLAARAEWDGEALHLYIKSGSD